MNVKKIGLQQLKRKSESLIKDYGGYKTYYRGFYPGMLTWFLSDPGSYLF